MDVRAAAQSERPSILPTRRTWWGGSRRGARRRLNNGTSSRPGLNGELVRRSSAVARTRRYHSHKSGLLYIGFTLLLALGAVNSQNNLLFLALGLAIGGLLISGILSGASLMGVRVERIVPGRASLGRPLRIRYRLANVNRVFSAFGLHVVESSGSKQVNANRTGGQLPWPRFFAQPQTFVFHVPPSDVVEADVVVTPRARGAISLESVRIWSTFPFGLTKKSVNFGIQRTILVLPPELPLRAGLLRRLTTRTHSGVGAENVPGRGEDFFGLREYIAGDSLRQIAWKRTARTGQVVVRQNAAPSPPRLWVVLNFSARRSTPEGGASAVGDANGQVLSPSALNERAIALAASILKSATRDGMAVGLSAPAAQLHHPPREGRAHLERLLTDLALLQPEAIEAGQATVLTRGGACVVIHAGPVDPGAGPAGSQHRAAVAAEQYLAMDDQSVSLVLAILDASEVQPGRRRRWLSRLRIGRAGDLHVDASLPERKLSSGAPGGGGADRA